VSKWPLVTLGDILEERKERVGTLDADGLPLLGVSNRVGLHRSEFVRIADMSRYLAVRREWFAYNPMRINVGSIGWAYSEDLTGVISPDYVVFSCTPRVEPELLYLYLTSHPGLQRINFETAGSVRERLYFSSLARVTMPLPTIEEQRRISARIRAVQAKLDAAAGIRRDAAELTNRLVAAEEFRIWPSSALPKAVPLERVTKFLARGRQTTQGTSEHHLIKTQHVQMGRYVRSTITLSPDAAAKVHQDAVTRPGDVLVACSAAGCLGRVAFYSEGTRRASTDSHVAIARADTDIVSSEYLYAYLRGAQGQVQLRSREKGDWKREKVGFRLTELNLADMRKVPVPVPSLPEQQRIVEYVEKVRSRVDSMKDLQARTATEIDAMLPAVLDRAFRGEL
jgi:restriction endonuclease S subunit